MSIVGSFPSSAGPVAFIGLLSRVVPGANGGGKEIWIAVRKDGVEGTGSEADPFDGSTQPKFDALMGALSADEVVHLGAGTFRTLGVDSWVIKTGDKVIGCGQGVTTVKLAFLPLKSNAHGFFGQAGVETDYVTIRDMTIDANYTRLNFTNNGAGGNTNPANHIHDKFNGIFISGSFINLENLEFINCYGDSVKGNEEFTCMIDGLNAATNPATHDRISNCQAHDYATGKLAYGVAYTNGFAIDAATPDAVVDRCVDDGAAHGFSCCGACSHCAELGGAVGYYDDSTPVSNISISNCYFSVTSIPIQFNGIVTNNISITDNILVTTDRTGVSQIIQTGGAGSQGAIITGNTALNASPVPGHNVNFLAVYGSRSMANLRGILMSGNMGHGTNGGYVSGLVSSFGDPTNNIGMNSFDSPSSPGIQSPQVNNGLGRFCQAMGEAGTWYRIFDNTNNALDDVSYKYSPVMFQLSCICASSQRSSFTLSLSFNGYDGYATILGNDQERAEGAITQLRWGTLKNGGHLYIDVYITGTNPSIVFRGPEVAEVPSSFVLTSKLSSEATAATQKMTPDGSSYFQALNTGLLIGSSGSPSLAGGPGAGTGSSIILSPGSTNLSGDITLTTGTAPAAAVTILTATLAHDRLAPNRVVTVVTPENANASALEGTSAVYSPPGGATAWTINSGSTALSAGTTYAWHYTTTCY